MPWKGDSSPHDALRRRATEFISEGNCIVWTGAKDDNGYGVVYYNYRNYLVHRLTWEICHGPVPAGYVIAHRCNNPGCAKESHLYLATIAQNVKDAARDGLLFKKLTPRKVQLICALLRAVKPGVTAFRAHSIIGDIFGVSYKTIEYIKKGTWYANART